VAQCSNINSQVYQTASRDVRGCSSVCSESRRDVSGLTCPPRCTPVAPSSPPVHDISDEFDLPAQPTCTDRHNNVNHCRDTEYVQCSLSNDVSTTFKAEFVLVSHFALTDNFYKLESVLQVLK